MTSALASLVMMLLGAGCGSEPQFRSLAPVDPTAILPCGFSTISGTRMSVYDCNPVFTATDEPWSQGVASSAFRTQMVLGHPVFQVWYTSPLASSESGWGLGHAISTDGVTWTPHPDNPLYSPTSGWDVATANALTVAYNERDANYALMYQGADLPNNSLGVGVLVSEGASSWRPPPRGSRLIDLLRTRDEVCWPLGMSWIASEGYVGQLALPSAVSSPYDLQRCDAYRFRAPGLDANELVVDSVPSVRGGPAEFDAAGLLSTAVVELDDTFYMFYVGFRSWEPAAEPGFVNPRDYTLALATSPDGLAWTKRAVFPVALTEPGELSSVGAQVIGERIHVWITDTYPLIEQRGIGYYLFEPYADAAP